MSAPILSPERRPLTARCQAEYDRIVRQFHRFQATLPEPRPPLAESVRTYLLALPGSARGHARAALQRRHPDLPWPTMPTRTWAGQGPRRRVRLEPPVETRPGRRIVAALTARHYRQLVRRFEAAPANGHATPEARAQAFLETLRPAVGHATHQALKWAYPEWNWPMIPKPRVRRNEPVLRRTLMAPEEREQFRASLDSPRSAALSECFFVLRRFEAAGLYWRDIDFQNGSASFTGKGNRPRLALLPERTLVALGAWFVASGCPSGDTAVFPGADGIHPLSPGRVSNLVRQLLRQAGVYRAYRGAHAWRRSWATAYLRENPDDLMGLKEALGHADIGTTQRYVYFDTDQDMRPRVNRVRL